MHWRCSYSIASADRIDEIRVMHQYGRFALTFTILLGLSGTFPGAARGSVRAQLDELLGLAQGKRIGMITNPSGCDETGALDYEYLMSDPGTTITAFFAPEHGIRGDLPAGYGGGDYVDPVTGIPVYAIFGLRTAPTDEQLQNVDILLFDLQDVGVRFYTYVWSMTYCMDAAARNGKTFAVIDRPNPIGGTRIEGSPNTADYGLVGRLGSGASFGVATRHGMTAGEIATMWKNEWMTAPLNLRVILMTSWQRDQQWTDTGRSFIPPSPNMRTYAAATVYPGTCIFEGTNLSEGRGTDKPFEKIGAPFVSGHAMATILNGTGLPGTDFIPVSFTPDTSKYSGQLCGGVEVTVTDQLAFDPIRTGLVMLQEFYKAYPSQVTINSYVNTLMATPDLQNRIKTEPVDNIVQGWEPLRSQFVALRKSYLLYTAPSASETNWVLYK